MSFIVPANDAQLSHVKAEDCYRSEAELDEDVTRLIEWLAKQPHLPDVTDRKWLSHFITGCKYSLQRSKQVIESYFIVRAELPEFFGSFTRKELEEAIKNGTICLFPKLTPECNRVICTKTLPSTDDDRFDVMLFCKASIALLDLQLREEPMYGNIILFDLKHIRLSQFLAFTPTVTKNLLRCCIDSFPLRVKAIHYVNPPKFMSRLVTFFKMFLSNKIKDRIFVHDSLETLQQYISKDVLPDIYGGTAENIEKYEERVIELLLNNNEWLEKRPKADLSKMPEREKSDELDMNGTFKKLQID